MFNSTTATFPVQNHDENTRRGACPNNNNNNNIYSLRDIIIIKNTEPGVSSRDAARAALTERRDEIIAAYETALEVPLRGTVAQKMLDFVASGHSVEQLLDAIERSGLAARPTPAYLAAVLRNYDTYQYQTFDRVQRFEKNPALVYSQRDYSNDDFDGDAFMDEARRMMKGDAK